VAFTVVVRFTVVAAAFVPVAFLAAGMGRAYPGRQRSNGDRRSATRLP
jgi:hypothetical protein